MGYSPAAEYKQAFLELIWRRDFKNQNKWGTHATQRASPRDGAVSSEKSLRGARGRGEEAGSHVKGHFFHSLLLSVGEINCSPLPCCHQG